MFLVLNHSSVALSICFVLLIEHLGKVSSLLQTGTLTSFLLPAVENPSIYYVYCLPVRVQGEAEANPADFRREAGYIQGRSPMYSRANTDKQLFTHMGKCSQLTSSTSLEYGRKPKHPEKSHAGTRRTCKLHIERSQSAVRFEPGTFLLWDNSMRGTTAMPADKNHSHKKMLPPSFLYY